ncbi:amidase [Streptomyces albus subsp. chlorinus]|uniref:amidase family protein n=1 Tax=Streptomyces albus TaxID=1888 RepID=UPI00156F8FCB|nr:amidase [Streptomyces albus]NSC21051.1 amidase [Streptomyces albus subsp. chlorinus]
MDGGMSACGIAAEVGAGRLSAREVADAALARIAERDGEIRAFTRTWPAPAAEYAAAVDRALRAGARLPLAGVPLAVKATQSLASPQVAGLVAAGCVPVGATATPGPGTEWQTWGATDRGPTRNPMDPRWSPGGSSAGSAAAVAARMVPLATGGDGAGSIRVPAAWCGVLGLKTTGGLAPARGRTVRAAPGPLARTAADAAAYLSALAHYRPSTDRPVGMPCDHTLTRSRPGPRPGHPLRTAWSATLGFADTEDQIATTAHTLLEALTGARLLLPRPLSSGPVRLPDPAHCWHHLRGGGPGPSRDAARTAHALNAALDSVFAEVDVLATPTTPNPPHGHDGPGEVMSVALTWAFNITGHPALSLPAGRTADGAPVGLQLVARHGREADLLAVAAGAEEEGLP